MPRAGTSLREGSRRGPWARHRSGVKARTAAVPVTTASRSLTLTPESTSATRNEPRIPTWLSLRPLGPIFSTTWPALLLRSTRDALITRQAAPASADDAGAWWPGQGEVAARCRPLACETFGSVRPAIGEVRRGDSSTTVLRELTDPPWVPAAPTIRTGGRRARHAGPSRTEPRRNP